MDRKFIVDKEINLKDFDYLKTDIYADNLVDVIDNTENNTEPDKVFTIGLFGSWGSGKSSIVTTAQDTLEKRTDQKIKFITYDAWQYANDSFRRMFLLKVKEELKLEDQDLLKRFYSNESHDVENKYKLSSTKTLWILGAIIMVIIGIQFFPKLEFDWKVPVTSFLTVLSVLIAVISGAFYQLKITETKPYLFAPEQFEDCFKQMIAISLKKFNWIHKALYVITGDKTVKDLDKLVIVIDNIDRCSNGTAYNLLTDIKTFLGSESYNIVFVIPVDDEALRKHILGIKNSNDGDDCNKDKEEFLRKFFNVTIRIKPYFETDMFAFAKAINDKYNLHFNNNTVNIVSKEYATNPRRIIQLFNNLNTELNLYKQDDGFAEKNETLICCLLILREEFNDFYKKVLNNPTLFIKGSIDNKDKDKDKDKDKEKDKEKEKEKRFINITRNYVTEKDYVTVSKILSNSNNLFPNIPEDIKDSINTNDTEKIIKFISENNSEAGSVFEYIIMQMDRAISNGLIETDFKDLFELILLINKAKEITKDTNIRINEKSLSHLGSIIESTTYHDELCLYATTQEKQKNQSLKNDIINYLINRDSSTPYWINLFNIVLRQFQDKEIAKKLKTIFIENNDKIDFSNLKLSADQFTYMVDDEYVNQKISDLIDLDLESKESGKNYGYSKRKKTSLQKLILNYFYK